MAAINGLAPILAPVIGAQILRFGDWRTVFWVLTGIGVVLWFLTLFAVAETLPANRRAAPGLAAQLRSFGVVLADRSYLGYVLAGTTVSAAMFGYIAASPFLLQDGFGLTAATVLALLRRQRRWHHRPPVLGRVLLRRFSRPACCGAWRRPGSAPSCCSARWSPGGGCGRCWPGCS